jgi:hypothetical protein
MTKTQQCCVSTSNNPRHIRAIRVRFSAFLKTRNTPDLPMICVCFWLQS